MQGPHKPLPEELRTVIFEHGESYQLVYDTNVQKITTTGPFNKLDLQQMQKHLLEEVKLPKGSVQIDEKNNRLLIDPNAARKFLEKYEADRAKERAAHETKLVRGKAAPHADPKPLFHLAAKEAHKNPFVRIADKVMKGPKKDKDKDKPKL